MSLVFLRPLGLRLDQKTNKIKNAIILILERCPQKKISSVLAECLTYGRKL